MEHFLSFCCFGGEPFLDFHKNSGIDPTDWSADLIQDLNATDFLEYGNWTENFGPLVLVQNCQFFNITFSDLPDQMLFDTYKANFQCRCPSGHFGLNCELAPPPIALPQISEENSPMVMPLVIAAVVLALMAVLAMMVKGCFCDCFGPFSREDPYDKPLDPEDVRRCLQKVRENQAAREMAREPLVSHPPPPSGLPPMVSESYSAPYSQAPPTSMGYPSPPPMNYRPPSPPPAYSAIDKMQHSQI